MNVSVSGERLFRALIENASDLLSVLDAEGRFTYVSPPVQRFFALRPEDLVGKSAFDFVHPEDRPLTIATFMQGLNVRGLHAPIEFRFRAGDGSWRVLEGRATNLLDDQDIAGIVINAHDITLRKQVEAELRTYQDRLRELVAERTTDLARAILEAQDARRASEMEKKRADDLLKLVVPLGVALAAEPNYDRLLERFVLDTMSFCSADAGMLCLKTRDGHLEYVIVHSTSLNIALGGTSGKTVKLERVPLYNAETGEPNSDQVAVRVALTGTSINMPDVCEADAALTPVQALASASSYRTVSLLAIPLQNKQGQVIGVLQLSNAHNERGGVVPFDRHLQELVESASLLAAAALESYRREQELRQEIRLLRVELDDVQQRGRVAEITGTPYFRQLQADADDLRQIINGE